MTVIAHIRCEDDDTNVICFGGLVVSCPESVTDETGGSQPTVLDRRGRGREMIPTYIVAVIGDHIPKLWAVRASARHHLTVLLLGVPSTPTPGPLGACPRKAGLIDYTSGVLQEIPLRGISPEAGGQKKWTTKLKEKRDLMSARA